MWTGSVLEKYARDLSGYLKSCFDDPQPIQDSSTENVQVINDITRFAVFMDVSQYKLEELRIHLIGRDLVVEGNQEKRSDAGYIQKSFSRRWSLPDEVDLDAIDTCLNEFGYLLIDAPKTGLHTMRRELPIRASPMREWEKTVSA